MRRALCVFMGIRQWEGLSMHLRFRCLVGVYHGECALYTLMIHC